jgi:hypothetical protein
MTLKTRKPTGAVPWPLILIEGGEKAGKSWASAVLSASPKVGRTFWIDLGEGAADEYGAIPGTDYEIVEHDGSFTSLYEVVAEISNIAADALKAGEKPVVLVIDSMSAEWDLIKDWATDRAKSSRANRKRLAEDPNTDVRVPMNLWNDANARHRKLMRLLMTFPGIAVMTARGRDVAAIGDDGQPVEGKKEYKVEAQRTLGSDASCWVRLSRDAAPVVVGARSVHAGIRPGVDDPQPMPKNWSLEWLIFDALKCDPATARVRDLVEPRAEAVTPEQIRDEALTSTTGFERIRELYAEAARLGYDDVTLINDTGDEELLLPMLVRLGNERRASTKPAGPSMPASEPERPSLATVPEPESKPRDTRPEPAKSDPAWLDLMGNEIDGIKSREDGTRVFAQLVAAFNNGTCTPDDRRALEPLIKAKVSAVMNQQEAA